MRDPRLARRYARALFAATAELGVSGRVAREFTSFISILGGNPKLAAFIGSPTVPANEKRRLMRAVLDGLVHKVLEEFLLLLERKRRFHLVGETAEEFGKLYDASRNLTRAEVTTAVALDEGERARLREALERRTGGTVEFEEKIDPAVIAGARVVLGHEVLDDTVRHHLERLRDELGSVPVHMTAEGASAS